MSNAEITQDGLHEIIVYLAGGQGAWLKGGLLDGAYYQELLTQGLIEEKLETGLRKWGKVRLTDKGWEAYDGIMENDE